MIYTRLSERMCIIIIITIIIIIILLLFIIIIAITGVLLWAGTSWQSSSICDLFIHLQSLIHFFCSVYHPSLSFSASWSLPTHSSLHHTFQQLSNLNACPIHPFFIILRVSRSFSCSSLAFIRTLAFVILSVY